MSEGRHWSELEMEEKLCYYQWMDTLLDFGVLPEMSVEERYEKIRRMYECDRGKTFITKDEFSSLWKYLNDTHSKKFS